MTEPLLKALVVDDDPIARRMVGFALQKEGFSCDFAKDGIEALQRTKVSEYELVVTDLCMPNKNGHEVSVKLLERNTRPVLVVHSSVDDPRLAKDLMSRGVDDIVYKPINYAAFAAKCKVLIERRRYSRLASVATLTSDPHHGSYESSALDAVDQFWRSTQIDSTEFAARLSTVCKILPLSQAAIHLLDEVQNTDTTAAAIAGIIQRDAALTADVLRLANSSYFSGTTRSILDIEEAVIRVGFRCLAELAVAMNALGALGKFVIPWFDKELASRRSLAGGIAVSRLLDAMGQENNGDGMVLAAVMYPLGRVILGTLYPRLYDQMLATSRAELLALEQLEGEVFPQLPSAATAEVLTQWGLPKEICRPLEFTSKTFGTLSALSEPRQSCVALVKTGILLGELAVGEWLPEDLIDVPSALQNSTLNAATIAKLIGQIRHDLKFVNLARHAPNNRREHFPSLATATNARKRLNYCNLSSEPVDYLRLLLTSMGYELVDVPQEVRDFDDRLVVNCIHASPTRLAAKRGPADGRPWLVVVTSEFPESSHQGGVIIRLPVSCAALRAACEQVAAGIVSESDDQVEPNGPCGANDNSPVVGHDPR